MKFRSYPLLTTLILLFSTTVIASQTLPRDAAYDVAFSPRGDSLETVLKGIQAARKSILVAAYSFTSKPIALALLDAHQRGVQVAVVADAKSNHGRYSAVNFLASHGVPVRLNSHYSIHHHKFMVIDGEDVETGSFNYSAGAVNKNAENVLLLWHVKPLAESYGKEWQRLWNEGEDVSPHY